MVYCAVYGTRYPDALALHVQAGSTAGIVPIDADGMGQLIRHACPQVRLAVLNSYWSSELARELAAVCGCAVGMCAQIPDSTAIAFVAQLYQAIAFGQSVGQAVATARAALELHGMYHPEVIQLVYREDVNPEHVFMIPSRLRPPMDRAPERPNATLAITRKRRYVAVVTRAGRLRRRLHQQAALIEHREPGNPVDPAHPDGHEP